MCDLESKKPPISISNRSLDNCTSDNTSIEFLREIYPICKTVMEQNLSYIPADLNDGMIRNEGFPDQTYDIWSAKGVHAYW